MTRPLFSVKTVATEALLPAHLTVGRAYFVQDEQIIIIDHGDGRGPVRYGDKPGPQGIAGEPIPSLQGQIDELAFASLRTSINIHNINKKNKADIAHLQTLITDNLEMLKSQNVDNANAIMTLLVTVRDKFLEYDSALNILAHTLSNLYPSSHGGTSGDGSNNTPSGIITADDGTQYSIENAYVDGDTGVVVVKLYNSEPLKEGDTVQLDNGYFVINTLDADNGIVSITLYES